MTINDLKISRPSKSIFFVFSKVFSLLSLVASDRFRVLCVCPLRMSFAAFKQLHFSIDGMEPARSVLTGGTLRTCIDLVC